MAILFIVMSLAMVLGAFMAYSSGKNEALEGHAPHAFAEDQGVKKSGVVIIMVVLAAILFALGIVRMGGV